MDIHERFEAVNDDYLKFELVKHKRSQRPDLHAFLLLDELFQGPGRDIISGAEHDQIFLDVEEEALSKLTDAQVLELTRCGVGHDSEGDCLYMFA